MGEVIDRYRVNDALSALANEFGVALDDDTLNELTHHVADVMDKASDDEPSEPEPMDMSGSTRGLER